MGRSSVRARSFTSRRKAGNANRVAAKAALILGRRMGGGLRAPLATRGFSGYRYGAGRAELKYIDVTATNSFALAAGITIPINLMAQGTDINQRVGRKVCMKSVYINMNFFPTNVISANAAQGVFGKCALIYDSQPNGGASAAAVTDIYATADPNSPLNLNNRDRFKVIWTKLWTVSSYNFDATPKIIAGAPQNCFRNGYRKLRHDVIFNGTGATIGNIATGSLLLVVLCDNNNNAMYDYYTRVRYSDN